MLAGESEDASHCAKEGQGLSAKELRADIVGVTLVCVFTILGPIAAFGWLALDFHGVAVFMTLYVITQNLPNFFSMGVFESWLGAKPFTYLIDYVSPFRVVIEEELDPERTYVIGWHPHGRVFVGIGVLVGQLFNWLPQFKQASRMVHVAINDAMFRIPLIGNWLQLLGLVPVNKHSIKCVLRRGDSVCIVVGGIDEVLLGTHDDKDVLYLRKRVGFAKIALESGAGLVPVFCFGENQLFLHSSEASLGFWRRVNAFVKLGAPFPIQGRWGLPIMFRRPLMVVWGRPLFAGEGESLLEFHARYIQALEGLYERHVGQTADPKRKLVVV